MRDDSSASQTSRLLRSDGNRHNAAAKHRAFRLAGYFAFLIQFSLSDNGLSSMATRTVWEINHMRGLDRMIHRTIGTGKGSRAASNVRKGGAPVALTTMLAAAMFAGNAAHAAPLDEHFANKVGGRAAMDAIVKASARRHALEKVAAHDAAVREHLGNKVGGQAAMDAMVKASAQRHAAEARRSEVAAIRADLDEKIQDIRNIQDTIEGFRKTVDLRHVTGAESADGGLALGEGALASASGSTAHGVGAKATAPNSVALGAHAVAERENTVSVGRADMLRTVSNVAAGVETHDAVNVQQLNDQLARATQVSATEAKNYTDQQVGEIRGDLDQMRGDIRRMDRSFRKGIASVAALQMTTPYAPGRVAVNAGTALYRGQGAVAVGVSYWNTAGDLNINAGVATAGSNSTVLRAGIGYLF